MVTMEVVQGPSRFRVRGCGDQPLLEQLEAAGVAVRSLCCVGACSTCAVRIQSGSELVERDAYGIGCSDDPGPELALLCVHGLLHLLGWDHTSRAETWEMRRLTRAALALSEVALPPGRF